VLSATALTVAPMGSDVGSVLAVGLLAAAVVFTAAAVPPLAPHSPGGGLEEVGDGVDLDGVDAANASSAAGGPGGDANTTRQGVRPPNDTRDRGGEGTDSAPKGSALGNDTGGGDLGGATGGGAGSEAAGGAPAGGVPAGAAGGDTSGVRKIAYAFGYFLQKLGLLGDAAGAAPSGVDSSTASTAESLSPTPTPDTTATPSPTSSASGAAGTATPSPTPDATPTPTATAGGNESSSEDELAGGRQFKTAGTVIVAVAAVLLVVYLSRSDRGPLAALRALPRRLRSLFMSLLFAVSDLVESAARRVRQAGSVLAIPGALAGLLVDRVRGGLGHALAVLPGDRGASAAGVDGPGDAEPDVPAHEQIRAAWRTVVDAAVGGDAHRRTPGDVQRTAVREGLPREAVRTVADSFRAVEYGAADPGEWVDPVRDATASLREHLESDDGDEGGA
jgi:hypothetical protein